MKDNQRQQFRWAPHTSGVTIVKPRDYDLGAVIEAPSPYAVWLALRGSGEELQLGDILEIESGGLSIFKYIGFEEARWYVPEPAAPAEPPPVAVT